MNKTLVDKLKSLTKEQRAEVWDALRAMGEVDRLPVVDADVMDAITQLQNEVADIRKALTPAKAKEIDDVVKQMILMLRK